MIYTAEDGARYRVYNDKWQVFSVNKWEDLENPQPIDLGEFTIPAYANHAAKMDEYERTLFIQHAQKVHLELIRNKSEFAEIDGFADAAVWLTKDLFKHLKKEGILADTEAPD